MGTINIETIKMALQYVSDRKPDIVLQNRKTLFPIAYFMVFMLGIHAQQTLGFEFMYGTPQFGDRSLTIDADHYGLGLNLDPHKKVSTLIHVAYNRFNYHSYHRTAKYDPDDITELHYSTLGYQKSFRLFKYGSRLNLYFQGGTGFIVYRAIEKRSDGHVFTSDAIRLFTTGAISTQVRLNKTIALKASYSTILPIGKKNDSTHNGRSNGQIEFYDSTNRILNDKNLVTFSAGLIFYPKIRTKKIRDSIRAAKDNKMWDRLRKQDSLYLARKDRNRSNGRTDNVTDLTARIGNLSGVLVSGAGADARITIRGNTSFAALGGNPNDPNSKNYQFDEPAFVVDGMVHNGTYAELYSRINIADVKSVRIGDSTLYGVRGGKGVIEIALRGGNHKNGNTDQRK